MDFEKILPFILLLIFWAASSILRKMGKTDKKNQGPGQQKSVLVKILQQLAAFREESSDEEFDQYYQPPSQVRAAEHEKESLIERSRDSLQQKPAVPQRETISVSPPAGVANKPGSTILLKKPRKMINRSKLQNAIIWAEILAPPVALRDQ